MSRTAAIALMAMAVIGCGDGETALLPANSPAILVDPQGSTVAVYTYDQTESEKESTPHGVAIPSGTRVLVLEDDEFDSANSENRMVEVRLLEGDRRELVGFVSRRKLRPVRAE
jgi:hypothetical protein